MLSLLWFWSICGTVFLAADGCLCRTSPAMVRRASGLAVLFSMDFRVGILYQAIFDLYSEGVNLVKNGELVSF